MTQSLQPTSFDSSLKGAIFWLIGRGILPVFLALDSFMHVAARARVVRLKHQHFGILCFFSVQDPDERTLRLSAKNLVCFRMPKLEPLLIVSICEEVISLNIVH